MAIDYRSLAAYRIMMGITLLYTLWVLFPDLGVFFTDSGLLPREAVIEKLTPRLSLLMMSGSYFFVGFLWVLNFIAAIFLLIGFRTRVATLVCLVIFTSFVGRNPLITTGGDVLLPLLLFWGLFLPTAKVFSVDAALHEENYRNSPPHFSIATGGLLLQALYVYIFGALLKTSPDWIPLGSAVYEAAHLDSLATEFGIWFRQFLLPMFLLTYFVYFLEVLAPILLFFPDKNQRVRTVSLTLIVLMHFGFRVFIDIGHFWLSSLSSLCAFIPGRVWNWISKKYWRKNQDKIQIYYDKDCGFCLKTALIFREFFLPRSVPVKPAQDTPKFGKILEKEISWVVVDPKGKILLHWEAVAYVLRQSPILAPIGWLATLFGKVGLGAPTYRWIGNNRKKLSKITQCIKKVPTDFSLGVGTRFLLILVIAYCFLWNVKETYKFDQNSYPILREVSKLGHSLGLSQRWNMFAPRPRRIDGYPVIEGTKANGETLDLFRIPPAPVTYEKPDYIASLFPSYRWRKYFNRIAFYDEDLRAYYTELYVQYLCRTWNKSLDESERYTEIKVVMVFNKTLSNFGETNFTEDVGAWSCSDD